MQILADPGQLLNRVQDHLQRSGTSVDTSGVEWRWLGRWLLEGLLSFALALSAWLALVPGAAEEVVTHQVVVELERIPQGYVLEGIKPATVAVKVAGSRRAMVLATAADFGLSLDVDAHLVELGRRTFEISVESIYHETDLNVVDVKPNKVRLLMRKKQ